MNSNVIEKEIEKLLESPIHKVRVGAVSIMDWQARSKKTPEQRRKELFDLYIRRHDRINGWDLVDRSAPYVVGGYLFDKPRDILYELAHSESQWERRTAIVATYFFIRQGDVDDTFKIAEVLVHDPHDLVQKTVGGWVRGRKKGPTETPWLPGQICRHHHVSLSQMHRDLALQLKSYMERNGQIIRRTSQALQLAFILLLLEILAWLLSIAGW